MSFSPSLSVLLIAIALVAPLHGDSKAQETKKDPTAAEILAKVTQTYSSCRSYSDKGTVAGQFTDPKGKVEKPDAEDRFTTAFVRPDGFKFDFRHNGPGAAKQSVIWIEKDGPRNWWDLDGKVIRPESLDSAFGAYAGITMGASTEIPHLLIAPTQQKIPDRVAPFSQLKDLKRLADVKVDGIDCYQVEGGMEAFNMRTAKPFQTRSTYEIDKATFLIRRLRSEMNLEIGKVVTTIAYEPQVDKAVDRKSLGFDPAKDGLAPISKPRTAARPGEPIDYQPFFPEKWAEKKQSTRMIPWEGERVVLLTTGTNFDPKTITVFLDRFDAGWKLYADLIGRQPAPNRQHKGKPTIAAVPDWSYTCGMGCGYSGATGIEVGGFYSGDYELVGRRPEAFPHYYFYEMGRNYYLFGNQMNSFGTGFAVFMRYVCMDTLECRDPDGRTRESIEKAESLLKATGLDFLEAFTMSAGMGEKVNRLNNLNPSDQPVLYASVMLKLRRDYGGDEWVKRFFHSLATCPNAGSDNSQESGRAQGLNWLIAASCAAKQDLSELFVDRWRLPLGPRSRAAFARTDWKASDLSPGKIIEILPADELPKGFSPKISVPVAPDRRTGNLLVDGSFEDGTDDRWSAVSWRRSQDIGRVVGTERKMGVKSLEIRSAVADDARFTQRVEVKPNTRYLLSGWIKTKDVVIEDQGNRIGANLSLEGAFEVTESLIGTNDWKYVSLVIDSGDRTEIAVNARLGFYSSLAKGAAWFDEISLTVSSDPAQKK
jgi:hypothetical protein